MKYIVDTCIINKLVDGVMQPNDLPDDGEFVATHIQIDELNKTRDTERRALLFLKFATTINTVVPTETAIIGVSRIRHCKITDGIDYPRMKQQLDNINNGKRNNIQDILIAEVALKNGYTLITADRDLNAVARNNGCTTIHWQT